MPQRRYILGALLDACSPKLGAGERIGRMFYLFLGDLVLVITQRFLLSTIPHESE